MHGQIMLGRTLSHYRVIEKLGQGGMGIVYKAQDLHLDRLVALKVLPQDKISDPERKRRFVHEAKAASALNHPNIITIYDIDEAENICFIAMEYVAGRTLQDMIRWEKLPLNQSLGYGVQIAEALAKAHSAGIIHRDLKPSNVMVTAENLVKVLDFGLAKLTALTGSHAGGEVTRSFDSRTGEGVVLGTLSYMSPEQARGQDLDHRSDIFSLGVVIYNMVAGQAPFQGPHAAAILDKLLYSPTPPLKDYCPDISNALERTIARATAKNPEDRYQSMQELATALRSISDPAGQAVTLSNAADTMGTAAIGQRKKEWRIAWRPVFFSAAVILLALLTAWLFRERLPRWLGGSALPHQIRLAVLPFNNVGADTGTQSICDGLMEILATKFNQVQQFQNTLDIVPASEVRTEKVLSPSHARRHFGANLVLTGSVQKILDRILLTINLVDTGTLRQIDGQICNARAEELITLEEDAFNSAASMLELELNPNERRMLSAGETRIPSAYNAYLQAVGYLARYDVGENVDKAIQLFQQAIHEDPRYALAHAGLGEAYWRKFRRTTEPRYADAALSSCLRAVEINSQFARVHVALGIVFTGTGKPEKAVDELMSAIALEPRSAEAYRELARAYEALGKMHEAEATYRKAIQLKPDSWSCYSNLGAFYYKRSQYALAAEQFLQVIRLAPDQFRAYSNLGAIYIYQGKFRKADEVFRKSLAIQAWPQAYSNLAASYILQGRYSEAVPLLEKAVAMEDASYDAWGNLADAYSQTHGLSSKAPAAYRHAVELAEKDLAVNSNSPARANLAFYLIKLGNRKRAIEEIERASKVSPEDQNILFWAAVVYESAGDRKDALDALSAAAARGYSLAVIRAVSDLKDLRKDPRYSDLVEGHLPH
jgi:tetratricopeptide (TPR) repeat protein/predicted Ser/Thr protein kinase